nr:MAG TPA: hypothetical protein [Caudoviricetes sp.]
MSTVLSEYFLLSSSFPLLFEHYTTDRKEIE